MGSITPEQNVVGTMITDLFNAKSQELVGVESLRVHGTIRAARIKRCFRKLSEDVQAMAEAIIKEPCTRDCC